MHHTAGKVFTRPDMVNPLRRQHRIADGYPATKGQFPYQVCSLNLLKVSLFYMWKVQWKRITRLQTWN